MALPLALSFLGNLVVVLFVLVCVALILIVLLQKGRGGGIGAAFGGGGAGSLLGTKTGDFLTWVTICLVAFFLVLAVLMGKFMKPTVSSDLSIPAAPAATEAPADVDAATESAEMPEVTLPAEAEEAAEAVVEKAEDVAADITEAAEEATEPAN